MQNENLMIIVVIVVIAAVAWLILKKRKKDSEESGVMVAGFSTLDGYSEDSMDKLCSQLRTGGIHATFDYVEGGDNFKFFQLQVNEKDVEAAKKMLDQLSAIK